MPATVVGEAATLSAAHPETERTGRTTSVAWSPARELDVRGWLLTGKRLGTVTRSSQWWLGDWVRYGTGRWGEKYKEASRITGYDVHSLRNIAYVAGAIEPSRRRDDLTYSHHAEVSALEPDEQDKWLALAAAEGMSVADLRIELRAARRADEGAEGEAKATAGTIRCPECNHEFRP